MSNSKREKEYRHRHDITITRAHIELAQIERAADKKPPLTVDELVEDFIQFPEQRHFSRARKLMKVK